MQHVLGLGDHIGCQGINCCNYLCLSQVQTGFSMWTMAWPPCVLCRVHLSAPTQELAFTVLLSMPFLWLGFWATTLGLWDPLLSPALSRKSVWWIIELFFATLVTKAPHWVDVVREDQTLKWTGREDKCRDGRARDFNTLATLLARKVGKLLA